MAIVDEKKIQEELNKKKLRSFYYIYGEELYKIEEIVSRIAKQIKADLGSDFQWELLFGDEVKAEQLCDSSDNFSLWQKKKGILIKNAEAIPAKQWELLRRLIDQPNENTILVFCASKADARTKHIQWMGKASEAVALVQVKIAEAWEIQQFAKQFAKNAGKNLDPAALELLQEWSGDSIYEVFHSIEKAVLFSPHSESISADHIKQVQVRTKPESIFAFTDALLQGNRAAAMIQLTNILEQGEDPIAILGLIARQYRWLLQILSLKSEGKTETAIATEMRLYPRQAKQLFQCAHKQGAYAVIHGMALIVDADKCLKSTREPPQHILERLSLALIV